MPNSLVPHWEAAYARALQQHALDGSERDVLALTLALVAGEDGTAIEDISLWSVRYRLGDTQKLRQTLADLLPGPLDHVATTVADARKESTRIRIDALVDEHGNFTGSPDLEDVFTHEIEAVIRDRGAFAAPAPLEGRIWRRWAALQAPHGTPFEDTLTSEELTAHDAMGRDGGYVASGKTVFEHSVQRLIQFLDRLLLPASGAPPLYCEVLVTGGVHKGRSGRLNAVTWSVDDEQRACSEPPASFTISFDDRYGRANIAPADVMPLPQWDRHFTVVYAGQPMPMDWGACVLLAGPEPEASWQHSVITVLKDGWQEADRLVVLVPHQPDGQMPSDEQEQWLRDAYAWADEIISTRAPVPGPGALHEPAPVFDLEGASDRLILQVATPDEVTRRWAGQRAVPVASTPADAAAAVLKRLDRGRPRQGGERQVRLPVVRNFGYHQWRDALRQAGRLLDAATIDWAPEDPCRPGEASWWAITAQVRHPDDLVTEELVVGRGDVLSLIAFRRHPVWTDSEVVLLRHTLSLGAPPPITAPTRFPLRLPTADFANPFQNSEEHQDQGVLAVARELGLVIDRARLRSLDNRPETALLAAQRRTCYLELTDDECEELKARHEACDGTAAAGAVQVHRVADLLSSRLPGDALVDWATLGVIMRAVVPTT
ncbi:hypothetical protein EJC51_18075 [Streptomyces aquilus]|uniref:Uncharacterized protein n=1 Tax=Streptomyces aquilus TaxID=2548456 RepID=A0A3Q9C059_9ACTN|nr:hypothetical protein [Streptomyces aquilus]AZP17840.1 hypothetical protein EJC51_18075 [Streptomyces aquilus]